MRASRTRSAEIAGVDAVPVILDPADFDAWLEPKESPIAQALLRPYPAERLRAFPISARVNSPKNDDPTVIEPVG